MSRTSRRSPSPAAQVRPSCGRGDGLAGIDSEHLFANRLDETQWIPLGPDGDHHGGRNELRRRTEWSGSDVAIEALPSVADDADDFILRGLGADDDPPADRICVWVVGPELVCAGFVDDSDERCAFPIAL